MKTIFKKSLILLATIPFIMGSSTLKVVHERLYKDSEATFLREEVIGDYAYYYFDLFNKGDGFISYVYFSDDDSSKNVQLDDYFYLFDNALLGPNMHQEVAFKKDYLLDKPEKVRSTTYGYNDIDDKLQVNGSKSITFSSSGADYFSYTIDINLQGERVSNYRYGVVAQLTYESSTYYVKINESSAFTFSTKEKLDLTKLTLGNIAVIKSTPNRSVDETLNIYLGIVLIFFFIVVPLTVFLAIFIPARLRRKRRKMRIQQVK